MNTNKNKFAKQQAEKLWSKVWRLAGDDLLDNRWTLLRAYFFGLLSVAALLLLPWPLKLIIDHVMTAYPLPDKLLNILFFFQQDPHDFSQQQKIILLVSSYTLISLFAALFGSAEKMAGAQVRENMVLRIRDKMLLHFQSLTNLQRSQYPSGDLGLYILVDVHHLVRLLTKTIPLIFRHIAITLFTLYLMFWLEPWLAIAGLVMVIILVILVRYQGRRLRESSRYKRNQEGIVSGFTQECVKGMNTVQALSAEDYIRQKFVAANRGSLQAGLKETAAAVNMERTLQIINGFAVAMIMGGGAMLVLQNRLTVGDLTVFVAYMIQLLKPVEKINEMASAVSRGLTRAEHLTSLLTQQPEVVDKPVPASLQHCCGQLEFRNVSFSYPGDQKSLLQAVNFKLLPGQMTVLTGPSGSGKSTLINLILRQLQPTAGKILVDQTPIETIKLKSLRAQFTVMLQQHHLFSGTLRDALWLSNDSIDDQLIFQILDKVGMADQVRKMPLGLDTILNEDGHNFSGGQRARLSLARSLLLNRPFLILDEPFANIDQQSQQIILTALDQIRDQKTILVISHLPVLIARADQLLSMKKGQLTVTSPDLDIGNEFSFMESLI